MLVNFLVYQHHLPYSSRRILLSSYSGIRILQGEYPICSSGELPCRRALALTVESKRLEVAWSQHMLREPALSPLSHNLKICKKSSLNGCRAPIESFDSQ